MINEIPTRVKEELAVLRSERVAPRWNRSLHHNASQSFHIDKERSPRPAPLLLEPGLQFALTGL